MTRQNISMDALTSQVKKPNRKRYQLFPVPLLVCLVLSFLGLMGPLRAVCCAAMMAFVGFASVYANRGQLPLQALKSHIEDPGQQNSAPNNPLAAVSAAVLLQPPAVAPVKLPHGPVLITCMLSCTRCCGLGNVAEQLLWRAQSSRRASRCPSPSLPSHSQSCPSSSRRAKCWTRMRMSSPR